MSSVSNLAALLQALALEVAAAGFVGGVLDYVFLSAPTAVTDVSSAMQVALAAVGQLAGNAVLFREYVDFASRAGLRPTPGDLERGGGFGYFGVIYHTQPTMYKRLFAVVTYVRTQLTKEIHNNLDASGAPRSAPKYSGEGNHGPDNQTPTAGTRGLVEPQLLNRQNIGNSGYY